MSDIFSLIGCSEPLFPELTEDEVSFVCESIKDFYKLGVQI
ncbi:hypothetical protein FACS1894137_15950 [Spirochaetia bacterium]|nr:hypothetical protein FACS1894137_15950 [Spirochaetia bacterium]